MVMPGSFRGVCSHASPLPLGRPNPWVIDKWLFEAVQDAGLGHADGRGTDPQTGGDVNRGPPFQAGHRASPAGDLLDALDEGHRRVGEEVRPVPPAELAQALGRYLGRVPAHRA